MVFLMQNSYVKPDNSLLIQLLCTCAKGNNPPPFARRPASPLRPKFLS